MTKTQTTRMNLPQDLVIAAKALEGRIYHSEKDNCTIRIDEIHTHPFAGITKAVYHPKGSYTCQMHLPFQEFGRSYRPATLAQAMRFKRLLKREQKYKF